MKKTRITKYVAAFASKALIMAFSAFFCVSLTCKGGITTYPIPKGEAVFDGYQLQVDGQPVAVYSCRVSAVPFDQWWPGYQRPVDQTELAGFAYWGMSGPVSVEITSKRAFTNV